MDRLVKPEEGQDSSSGIWKLDGTHAILREIDLSSEWSLDKKRAPDNCDQGLLKSYLLGSTLGLFSPFPSPGRKSSEAGAEQEHGGRFGDGGAEQLER